MGKRCVTVVAIGVAIGVAAGRPVLAQSQDKLDEARARVQIGLMEAALSQAVKTGASRLINELINTTQAPAEAVLLRPPQAQGFRLRDYGMFFYVLVPDMRGTAIVAMAQLVDEQRRNRRVQSQLQPPDVALVTTGPPVAGAEPPPLSSPFENNVLNDPQGSYVRSVKKELIEAIIENSAALRIPPDGFLTVAARRDSPQNPLDPTDEVRTMTFSVKGSDLMAYHQRRASKDDTVKLVTVTED